MADGLEFKLWGQGDQVHAFVGDILAQDIEVVAEAEIVGRAIVFSQLNFLFLQSKFCNYTEDVRRLSPKAQYDR